MQQPPFCCFRNKPESEETLIDLGMGSEVFSDGRARFFGGWPRLIFGGERTPKVVDPLS